MIKQLVRERIQAMLDEVERERAVRILLAVESGSRAWGFPSADSDYDVRFVYIHPPDWYLSIDLERRRDTIEYPLREEIDLAGWDVRKALKLFRKSNPPFMEWLRSPVVYREDSSFAARMRGMVDEFCSPRASFYHYFHMAHGNMREYLQGEVVWRKKYLYVLRPLLALRWIESGRGAAPMEFEVLLDAILPAGATRSAINELVETKRNGGELDRGPRIATISEFIEAEFAHWADQTQFSEGEPAVDEEPLNRVFRSTLFEVFDRPRSES